MSKKLMMTFVVSDESINSYGFIVDTDGIDISLFLRNPVMLYEHEPTRLIGMWENIRKENRQLLADARFDMDDPDAVKIARKVEKGILRGASVGLIVVEFGERVMDGEKIPVLTKSILKEISLTALPSNRNALRLYDANGIQLSSEEISLAMNQHLFKKHMEKNSITKMLGLSPDSTETQIIEKIKTMAEELEQLQAKIDEFEKKEREHRMEKITDLINMAIILGKIRKDQRDDLIALAEKDYEAAIRFLSKLSLVKPGQYINKKSSDEFEQRSSWTFDDWRKRDPKGLLELKADHPEKYNELLKTSNLKLI